MELVSPADSLEDLMCAACGCASLHDEDGAVRCPRCGRSFESRHGVLDFVMVDELDEDGRREHVTNAVELSSKRAVRRRVNRGVGNHLLTAQTERSMRAVDRLMAGFGEGDTLVSIGSGAGFELRSLLRRRRFRRVYSSDLAWSATSLVPQVTQEIEGELGLFAAAFDQLPVRKRPQTVGFVFLALHHAADPHRSLERLLTRNFDHLVMVEPITNWLVELLARVGLARRLEYSGAMPQWLRVSRLRRIASEQGCSLELETWWEIPRTQLPLRVRTSRRTWWPLFALVEGISWLLRPFRFGSMAAIRFSRPDQPLPR